MMFNYDMVVWFDPGKGGLEITNIINSKHTYFINQDYVLLLEIILNLDIVIHMIKILLNIIISF